MLKIEALYEESMLPGYAPWDGFRAGRVGVGSHRAPRSGPDRATAPETGDSRTCRAPAGPIGPTSYALNRDSTSTSACTSPLFLMAALPIATRYKDIGGDLVAAIGALSAFLKTGSRDDLVAVKALTDFHRRHQRPGRDTDSYSGFRSPSRKFRSADPKCARRSITNPLTAFPQR